MAFNAAKNSRHSMSEQSTNWRSKINKAFGALKRLPRTNKEVSAVFSSTHRLELALEEHRREMRLVLSSLTLPPAKDWTGKPAIIAGHPADNAFPESVLCRQDSFDTPYFPYWTARLGEGLRYHRKIWEFVFICQALWERGAIKPRARGLGFGVGVEPLSAYFASQDCEVVATDMSPERAEDIGWISTNEHAAGKEALRKPVVCPDTLFDANVSFQECDMNHIPDTLTGFDFCWSACALEHLGSIEKGLAFIERSITCLKPGGWAVHTTEFNISSNTHTVDNLDTVLFRKQDLDELARRLTAQGHKVAPLNYDPGDGVMDRYIDVPPYREIPHLKFALWGYSVTSVGIIVQRGT